MAKNNVIEITDEFMKSFKILVSTGFRGSTDGDWQAMEQGFIRYSGGVVKNDRHDSINGRDICLFGNSITSSALTLNQFESFWGVKAEGTGFVFHDWVVGIRAGRISWKLIS